MKQIGVAEKLGSIFGDKFVTRCRSNALTAHVQILLFCLKHTALDGLPCSLEHYLVHPKATQSTSFSRTN